MGHLIFGIVMNVLAHVAIERQEGRRVGWTPATSGNFAVMNSSEFVVLLPEIGLDKFSCGEKAEDGHIANSDDAAARGFGGGCEQ